MSGSKLRPHDSQLTVDDVVEQSIHYIRRMGYEVRTGPSATVSAAAIDLDSGDLLTALR